MTETSRTGENFAGQIKIADEVIAAIAGTAALETEGVAALAGNFVGDVTELMGKKPLSKGVRVATREGAAVIDVNLSVRMGFRIHEVCESVQVKVKDAIETMTGLVVAEINVYVSGILQDKPKKS